ncbi:uncharacterized protein LOC114470802 [Gouania willdenowi]|uniref:uncharacterized protein LOC114470802 n=1 Tax=Gouania willdenowi TaxID=441366 RepID=UPI0010556D7E|nr:uncharacterized protein LOC114470802 [Gouania willdenowi]
MEKINITAETEVSSDKLSCNEPANPKCNECGKMLNREREMDSILQSKNDEITNLLSLDEAQQELKVKLEKKDLMLELKEEEISYFSFLLDEMEKELDMKNSQWEDSLELKLEELREKVQAQKKQLDEEKAALLDITNELQNKEQMFLKQKDEQQIIISHLEATLKMKEDDLKSRTDQWNHSWSVHQDTGTRSRVRVVVKCELCTHWPCGLRGRPYDWMLSWESRAACNPPR